MSLSFDRDNTTPDTPVVDGALWKGIAVALLGSVIGWSLIIGLGYLGYRLSAIV